MTAPIQDVSSLPGKKVYDQEQSPIGEIKEIYAMDGDGQPMWVTVEASFGMGNKKIVFIPLARLKEEDGDLLVPYGKDHIENTPEIDGSDGISAECDRKLRDHFGIDRADQELRSDNDSYATLVPDEDTEGTAQLAEDVDSLETPDANQVDDETRERLEDVGSSEIRKVTAEDVVHDDQDSEGSDDEHSDSSDDEHSHDEDSGAEEHPDEEHSDSEKAHDD